MPGHTHFAESTEEYLEAIYRLEREGPGVTTSGLAADLGVAPASVSGMLKKLASDGYLTYTARSQATLTDGGLAIAIRVVRRNRLAEVFLHDVLGMPWDQVHPEACRLEHAISDHVEERLAAVLGDPKVCPHGHPIPALDAVYEPRHLAYLTDAQSGASVRIVEVVEDDSEMLRLLDAGGLRPGKIVQVVERAAGGAVTVTGPSGKTVVPFDLARLVAVAVEADSALSA